MSKKNTLETTSIDKTDKEPETEELNPVLENWNEQKDKAAIYRRNSLGLLQNFKYNFNEDGSVDYKKAINPKYIVLNRDKKQVIEEKYGRNFDELQTSIQNGGSELEDIDDQYKLILLAGIKELAKLRGYTYVDYINNATNGDYVATKCTIQWIPNYETNNLSISFAALADAHINNVKGFTTGYLNTISENRSFVRAVRNFLGIHVLGYDEIGSATPIEESPNQSNNFSATDPRFVLVKKFEKLQSDFKVSWSSFQKYLVEKKNVEDASNWKTINDVPKDKAYDILGFVSEQQEKLDKKKNS